mgnify:CR=1 FL=1
MDSHPFFVKFERSQSLQPTEAQRTPPSRSRREHSLQQRRGGDLLAGAQQRAEARRRPPGTVEARKRRRADAAGCDEASDLPLAANLDRQLPDFEADFLRSYSVDPLEFAAFVASLPQEIAASNVASQCRVVCLTTRSR